MLQFLLDLGYQLHLETQLDHPVGSATELLAHLPDGRHTINIVCQPAAKPAARRAASNRPSAGRRRR